MEINEANLRSADPKNENEKIDRLFEVYESSFKLYHIAKYMSPEVLNDRQGLISDYSGMLGTLYPKEKEQLGARLASGNPVPAPASAEFKSAECKEEEKEALEVKIEVEADLEESAKKAASFGCMLPMWSIFLDKVAISSALNVLVFEVLPFIEEDVTLLSFFFRITEPHLASLSENDVIIVFDSLV